MTMQHYCNCSAPTHRIFQRSIRIVLTGLFLLITNLTACVSNHQTAPIAAPDTITTTPLIKTTKITLLLPLHGNLAAPAEAIRDGFIAAAYENMDHPQIDVIDSTQATNIQAAYQQAVATQAQIIVGPLEKKDVQAIATLGNTLPIITLALNTVDIPTALPKNLYQFGLSPQDEAQQAAEKAWQDGYRQAVIITPAGTWGLGIAQAFQEKFKQQGGTILSSLAINNSNNLDNQIKILLNTISSKNNTNTVILLAAQPDLARRVHTLIKYDNTTDLPTYGISLLYSGTPNPEQDHDQNGVIFCDMPWVLDINNPLRIKLQPPESPNFNTQIRLYGLGIDAYLVANNLRQADPGFLANFHMIGVTGNISLNANRQITRQLTCAQFRDGTPVVLSVPMSIL